MDFSSAINSFAQKASVSDLFATVIIGVLVYLLKEEREARLNDAKLMAAATEKMADAMEKFTAALADLRVAIAQGGRNV